MREFVPRIKYFVPTSFCRRATLSTLGKEEIPARKEYYEARNDYTNNSETILLCNRCVCNWKVNSQRILLCNWRLQKIPHGGAQITQNNPCQKALCNRCPVQLGN